MPEFIQGDLFDDFAPQPSPKPKPEKEPQPAPGAAPEPDPQPEARTETGTTPPPPQEPPPAPRLPPSTKRIFLGWDRPVVDSAADLLLADHAGQRLTDLSDLLVIVPTQHAGRRLREALATRAAESDGAVIPPLLAPPEFLISPDRARPAGSRPVAGHSQLLLIWADVLRSIDLDQFRQLFPVDPVDRSFSWAIQTAGDILAMRRTLGEAGIDIAAAAEILADQGMEPARWRQLAQLEHRAGRRLENAGLTDIETAHREAAENGEIPAGIKKVLVLATPDPTPLAIDALRKIASHTPIEIAIQAPESRTNHFDIWGRPITNLWTAEQVPIPEPLNTIHLSPNPSSQAELASQLLSNHGDPSGLVAVGAPDDEVVAPLERELAAGGFDTFNPGGSPLQNHEVFYLLRVIADLLAARPYSAFAQLIRIPDFARSAAAQYEQERTETYDHLAVLRNFDALHNANLPDTLEHLQDANSKAPPALVVPEQAFTLTLANRWLARLEAGPLSRELPAFLTMVYSHRSFDPADAADRAYAEISTNIRDFLEEVEAPATGKLDQPPSSAELLGLLLQLLAKRPFFPERPHGDSRPTVDLQGWLELPWEDAPHLIVTGFNEGKVPEAIIGDAYLPNQARAALGLRDNEARLARDIYYLTTLIQSRQHEGRVDLLVGKTATDNTPLSPSRLLFLCPDDELPARTKQLFSDEVEQTQERPAPWGRAFQLELPPLPADAKIRTRLSVTQFGDYLRCPFRFFLKHGLRMEAFDRHKLEMDNRDFGTLCHDALEDFGREPGIRDSTDHREIAAFLSDRLDRMVNHRFGSTLPVPILIQLESAKQRLAWAAEIQARERAAGWQIIDVEWSVPKDPETELPQWQIAGQPIACKIDRIERHELTGALRVLDYKTSDKAASPYDSHFEKIPWGMEASAFPDWVLATGPDGYPRHWVNLQLPLYILALRANYPAAADADPIVTGFFKLPRAKSDTEIDLWEDLDGRILAEANSCATRAIEHIRDEVFWPPSEKVRYDDFKPILFEDALASVRPPAP